MSEEIGYAVVLAANLGDRRTLTFQFNFAQNLSAADMNTELDKLAAVLDRQVARAELPSKREELKAQKLMAEVIADDIQRMQDQVAKAADVDPARRNKVNTQQLEQNITAQGEALKKTRRMVSELGKIVGELEQKAA